jgi:energy-coupling factor transporter transmembrane protein EcfT
MGCTTIILIIVGIIIALVALGVSIYFILGAASFTLFVGRFFKWAIPRLKNGNPSVFIPPLLIGALFLFWGYSGYLSSKRGTIYGYGTKEELTEEEYQKKVREAKPFLDMYWEDELPLIISGYILAGIGVAGTASTVIIYQVKKRKSEEDTEA